MGCFNFFQVCITTSVVVETSLVETETETNTPEIEKYFMTTKSNFWPHTVIQNHGVNGRAGVIPGQLQINLFRKAIWQPNLVTRTLTKRLMHCSKSYIPEVILGQSDVNLLWKNHKTIWLPNVVTKPPDKSVKHRVLGSKVIRDSFWVNRGQLAKKFFVAAGSKLAKRTSAGPKRT